ncbi:Acid phosphatase-like protein 2 [Gryganskiella cystojenkinii]|nr:Acid phosphatase-like protein 2 [Gryganskiella cystojenkinii]
MQFLKISLAVVAILAAQVAGQSSNTTTDPIYSDYNYCQGISPVAHKTYQPIKGAKLHKVQVMMRHGDRTPAYVLPGDHTNYNICSQPAEFNFMANNKNSKVASSSSPFLKNNILVSDENLYASSYWGGNCEIGQLTNRGSQQTVDVGTNLRSIYVDELKFLPSTLDADQIYARNTYVWRTKESAENFFAGFYPLKHRRHGVEGSVITLNTYPQSIETLTLNPTACPKLGLLYQNFFKTPTYLNYFKTNYALMTKVNTILGVTHVPTYNTTLNGDAVMPRYCNKLPLGCSASDPKQCLTKDDVVQTMTQSTFMFSAPFRFESTAEEVKRLAVGPFLKTLSSSIRATTAAATKRNPSKKRVRPFELYSAHDQSLDQVLAVIAEPNTPWPGYASSVIFETWETSAKKLVVRVLYEGRVVPANANLKCTLDACPLDVFLAFIESYVPKDIATECSPY